MTGAELMEDRGRMLEGYERIVSKCIGLEVLLESLAEDRERVRADAGAELVEAVDQVAEIRRMAEARGV